MTSDKTLGDEDGARRLNELKRMLNESLLPLTRRRPPVRFGRSGVKCFHLFAISHSSSAFTNQVRKRGRERGMASEYLSLSNPMVKGSAQNDAIANDRSADCAILQKWVCPNLEQHFYSCAFIPFPRGSHSILRSILTIRWVLEHHRCMH